MNFSVRRPSEWRLGRATVRTAISCVLVALPACRIPGLRPAVPGPALPDSFNGATSPTSSAETPFREFYTDPLLVGLIDQALASNQELKALNEEVRIANNEVLARTGAYLPSVGLEAGGGFERNSQFTPLGAAERQLTFLPGKNFPDPVPRVHLGARVLWQVDIWRELRNARDAAIQRYEAAGERRNGFVTRLVADVAENYFGLLALDQRLEVLDQTITLQEQSLKLAIARKEAGRGTELAVQRFQAEVRKNQSEKLIVRQEIVEGENRVNLLAGRFPQPVERAARSFIDLVLAAPDVGLPTQLLRNRPDIRRAERELAAAGLDVLVARAHFFPRLDITAGIGYEAFNPKYLFDPGAFIASAAGGFVAPFVNRRAIQAEYQSANARQLQAVYNYQRVVLDAFTEVVTRVSAADNYRKSIEIKKQQLQALEASVDAASKLFQNARAEYIEVLFAQRDLLEARTVLIDTKRRQLSAIVTAYQALGGGDSAAAASAAIRPLPQGMAKDGSPAVPAVP